MRKLLTTSLLIFILVKATYAQDNNIIEEKDLNQNRVIEIETGHGLNPIPLPVVLLSINGPIQEEVIADPLVPLPVIDDSDEEETEKVREPILDKPILDKPIVDKPINNRPIIGRPIIDRPIIDKPNPDNPRRPEPEPSLFPIPDKPLDQELEEYANGFWKFYDKRPLLGNFVLGGIIIGLLYVFFLVSNFISETTGEKQWLAAIIIEPYEQITPVISMFFSKKDKK